MSESYEYIKLDATELIFFAIDCFIVLWGLIWFIRSFLYLLFICIIASSFSLFFSISLLFYTHEG